ncbi:MAG: KamA family radical SAM protein [Bacteriovoracaceae bacterium]|nr:KamA family radical SAM protein [Bacteriovoracaceae bacterium]
MINNVSPIREGLFSVDWQQDFREALKSLSDLENYFEESFPQIPYSVFIPRPYAFKIKNAGIDSPLGRQFLPAVEEHRPEGLIDPISDELFSKGKGIIHRYKNRILFTPTEVCPIQCRYCFRKNELLQNNDVFKNNLEVAVNYATFHPQVEEVILTGGDPLILANHKIEEILAAFSKVKTVKMIRFHTRTPVILPNRIDEELIDILKHFSQKLSILSLVIHTNHLSEWTPEFLLGLQKLRSTGLNLLSQSVLLKGVNDNWFDLKILFSSLVSNGVTPYYLHHPDPTKGAMHFMISREEGKSIYKKLKEESSGFLLPHYVIEQPNGAGKVLALKD